MAKYKPPKLEVVVEDNRGKDIDSLEQMFKRFGAIFKVQAQIAATKTSKKVAQEIVKEAKEILETQRYNWKPLKDYYKRWKIKEGLDERILIATGFYRDNIKWWVDRAGNIHFGVRPKVIHKPSGMPLWQLARIHEYGTRRIPSRPLWRPLLSKHLRNNKRFANMYKRAVAKGMRSAFRG